MSFFAVPYCAVLVAMVVALVWAMLATKTPPWTREGALVVWIIVVLLASAYCVAASDVLFQMGGSAANGKIVGDRHFLGHAGRYTEVSETIWWYSYWHDRIEQWIGWIFVTTFITLGVLGARRRARMDSAVRRTMGDFRKASRSDSSDRAHSPGDSSVTVPWRDVSSAAQRGSPTWFLVPTIAAVLLGGSCAAMILSLCGPALLWHMVPVLPIAILLAIVSERCPGGRGIARRARGAVAIVLGFTALVGASLMLLIVYRAFVGALLAIPDWDLRLTIVLALATIFFMDVCFASGFVGTLRAVFVSDDEQLEAGEALSD